HNGPGIRHDANGVCARLSTEYVPGDRVGNRLEPIGSHPGPGLCELALPNVHHGALRSRLDSDDRSLSNHVGPQVSGEFALVPGAVGTLPFNLPKREDICVNPEAVAGSPSKS